MEVNDLGGGLGMKGVLESLSANFGGVKVLSEGELHATVFLDCAAAEPEEFAKFFEHLKALKFKMLIDICGVDYPENARRFEVVYQLLNLEDNLRMTVKLQTNEEAPTLSKLYSSAGWFERETFDMFGVKFVGNEDLRRILTDYGFEHFPLRKDFPTTGFTEVRYDGELGEVRKFPVNLSQEYRVFDFEMPWDAAEQSIKKA